MKKYNLTLLKEQCGNDVKFFNEMLDIFNKSTSEGLEQLEAALKKKDMQAVGHYAHKIVSPCRHIDAGNLIILLKEIETKAETNELSQQRAEELITQVKKETEVLLSDLKSEYM
jgi:HPt (histidine-containing phosphotransfer) domain-containing protein